MRFIMTFFWSFVLVNMAMYVISSMSSVPYTFATASILSVVFAVLVMILGEAGIPNEPVHDHH
ncbi:DUF2929 family protein [Priestia megaterium]|nr:DUF2929 family protein [Priestia megaterium]